MRYVVGVPVTGLFLCVSALAAAQVVPQPPGAPDNTPGTPAPLASVSRDAEGNLTVRAFRISETLQIDGQLTEPIYQSVTPIGDFIQTVPKEGAPATERTDAWVMYDDENMYVAARCWDTAPPERWVANELRRDTNQLRNNDTFGVMFDTFHDRRSGFAFYTNVLGALADYAIIDEGMPNTDWNPVWSVRTGRFAGGWSVEMVIPFKSLRYQSGLAQTWGIQFRRAIRRKNEWVYLTRVPASMGGPQGLNRVSLGANLVGLDLPSASKNIELKPYVISRNTTDRLRTPRTDWNGDAGGDAKFAVTANLTADLTVNTDFAQVEIDEQQVNLTRFNLFFPEKREFFLEGRGLFDFGRGGAFGGGGPTGGGGGSGGSFSPAAQNTSAVPYLFYSRRIGLNRNREVPIQVGGRLTGKAGRFGIGLLNIQTGDEAISATPDTNFTVLRVKGDVLRRSSVGAMFTNRTRSNLVADGSNQAVGLDGAFSFYQNIAMGGYWARTTTPGLTGDAGSYQTRFEYNGDRYGARVDHLYVGDNFNPEVGFVQRDDFRRSFASLRFSPRPTRIPRVRKFSWETSLEYILNGAGAVETRQQIGRFTTEFETSDVFSLEATRDYELLVVAFPIGGVRIPAGSYQFNDVQATYTFGAQRRASGSVSLQLGQFYDGTITGLSYSGGRVSVTRHLSLEPSIAVNQITLPVGDFTTRLYRTRTDYAFSPRMFASALLQYSSTDTSFSSNLRFRWEYQPGSELFVVYTDDHDTRTGALAGLKNRAFVVKFNRLFRF